MRVGVFYFPTDYGIEIGELARALEERGFESLFVCEHTHIPTSRRTPFPGGGELPKRYAHTHDPFVALSFAAAATKNLMLGTGICLITQRDPIVTAKAIASLDMLSGGRFIFGIGTGWLREEIEIFGGDFPHRWTQTREALDAMKAVWTNDAGEYHGKYFDFPPVRVYPKPAQKPYPPIVIGGAAKNVFKRIVQHADGWLPNRVKPEVLKENRAELNKLAEAAGRDPASIEITIYGQEPDPDLFKALFAAGADRVVVRPQHVETEKEMGQQLDQIAAKLFP